MILIKRFVDVMGWYAGAKRIGGWMEVEAVEASHGASEYNTRRSWHSQLEFRVIAELHGHCHGNCYLASPNRRLPPTKRSAEQCTLDCAVNRIFARLPPPLDLDAAPTSENKSILEARRVTCLQPKRGLVSGAPPQRTCDPHITPIFLFCPPRCIGDALRLADH